MRQARQERGAEADRARHGGRARVDTGRMRRRGRVMVVMTTWQETRAASAIVARCGDARPGHGPDGSLRFSPRIQPLGQGQAPRRWSARLSPLGARLSSGTLGRSRARCYTPDLRGATSCRACVRVHSIPQLRIPRGKNGPNLEGRAHALRTQARAPVTPPARREPPNAQRGEDARPAGLGHRARARATATAPRRSPPRSARSTRPPRRASCTRTTPRVARAG